MNASDGCSYKYHAGTNGIGLSHATIRSARFTRELNVRAPMTLTQLSSNQLDALAASFILRINEIESVLRREMEEKAGMGRFI